MWLGKSDLTDEHCPNRGRSRICSKCTTTCRGQLVRRGAQVSRRAPQKPRSTATDDTADIRTVPDVRDHDNENEEKNKDDCENEKLPDKPEDDDHGMQGETTTEPDTTAATSRNTRKCVHEETSDDEVTKATDHTYPIV